MQLYVMKLLELLDFGPSKKRCDVVWDYSESLGNISVLIEFNLKSLRRFFSFKICDPQISVFWTDHHMDRQQSWWMSDWLFTFLFGKCDV